MVDARDHQIDTFVAQQVVESHFHAVDRCSRKGVNFEPLLLADTPQVEGIVHRDGLTHAALRRLGGHDNHTAEPQGHLDGSGQAFGIIAVVVGDKYQFFIHLSNRFPAKVTIYRAFFMQ